MKFLIFFHSNYTYFYFTYGNKFSKEGFFRWPFVKKNHLAVNFPPPGWTPFWSWYQDRLLNSSSLMYCDLITCYHEMKNHLIFGDEKNKLIFLNIKIHVQLAYLNSILTIKKPCVCRHRKYAPYFKAVLTCTYTYTRAIHTVFTIDVSMENQNWLILC